MGLGYAISELEEMILLEMEIDGWYKDMPPREKKEFYERWWSKRLN